MSSPFNAAEAAETQSSITDAAQLPQVVLQRVPGTTDFRELGLWLDGDNKAATWQYVTSDGTVEEAARSTGLIRLLRGSVLHVMRAYPDQFVIAFNEHPVEVISQMVTEKGTKGTIAASIKSELEPMIGDEKSIRSAWAKAQKHFASHDDFLIEGKTYRKRNDAPLRWQILEWVSIPEYEVPAETDTRVVDDEPDARRSPEVITDHSDDHISGETSASTPVTDSESAGDEATLKTAQPTIEKTAAVAVTPEARASSPLIRALSDLGTYVRSLDEVAAQILPIATHLASSDGLLELPAGLSKREVELWHLLRIATPRRARSPQGATAIRRAVELAALEASFALIGSSDRATRDRLAPSVWALIDGLVVNESTAAHTAPFLTHVIAATAGLARPSPYDAVLGDLVARLADHLEKKGAKQSIESLLVNDELEQFASALGAIPVQSISRVRVLRALHEYRPEELVNERWWHGLSAAVLIDAARGMLGPILTDRKVIRSIIEPRLRHALGKIDSRKALFEITSSPAAIAELVSPDQFHDGLARVAGHDPIAAGWMRHLTQSDALEALRAVVDDERQQAAEATREIDRLKAEVTELEQEREHLLERARSARNAAAAGQEARDRQTKLKTLRCLAELAAAIAVSTGPKDAVLDQRASEILAREELSAIEQVGRQVPYDPGKHDAQGQMLDAGQTVIVVRPGYNVQDGDQNRTLIKARVTG